MAEAAMADRPVDEGRVRTAGRMLDIVAHPAFRLGFLDALAGRAMDHDRIMDRIAAETPATALARVGWNDLDLPGLWGDVRRDPVALAQFRYEEGRQLQREHGLRCRAWGHPDYPPAAVRRWCVEEAARRQACEGEGVE